jgi:hypothetical protein
MRTVLFCLVLVLSCTILSTTVDAAPRKVLVEIFTSTTCSPCYGADNFYFNQWLPSYGGADRVVTIAYHVWWPSPGTDPMYLANPAPVQTRNTYYGNNAAPNGRIDGFVNGGSGYNSWPGAIEARFLDASPITITLSGTRNGNTLNMNASIFAQSTVNSSNWRVHWVVVEDGISEPQNSPSGYVPFIHDAAHRGMYPDANGSAISITQGQTVNIPRSIPIGSGWVANNCKVIVFVQNNSDLKVQQVEVVGVDQLTDVNLPTNTPLEYALAQNYPNPFNPETRISFTLKERGDVAIRIYNLLGQEVRTLLYESRSAGTHVVDWNGEGNDGQQVPTGMYLYKMTTNGFAETKKMMILR